MTTFGTMRASFPFNCMFNVRCKTANGWAEITPPPPKKKKKRLLETLETE